MKIKFSKVRLEAENKKLAAENKKLKQMLAESDYQGAKFYGSKRKGKKLKHFHLASCKNYLLYLKNSPNLIEFDSHEEARAAGYKPCKTCRA